MGMIWVLTALTPVWIGAVIALFLQAERQKERYVKLEEWAEDWMKRLEQRTEANEEHIAKLAVTVGEMEQMLPKGGNGELIRNQVLLQQMNDELERNLNMEREWNEGIAAILNYGKPKTRGE